MVKLCQTWESDGAREDGKRCAASSFGEGATSDGRDTDSHQGGSSRSSRWWWWWVVIVAATMTGCVFSIVLVVTPQPSGVNTRNRWSDFVGSRGSLRPPAHRTDQEMGWTGNENGPLRLQLTESHYDRLAGLKDEAKKTDPTAVSPAEQECSDMLASLQTASTENEGKAGGVVDQQRWDRLGCNGILNGVGYPGGSGRRAEEGRSAGSGIVAQTHPLTTRNLAKIKVAGEALVEEDGQPRQDRQAKAKEGAERTRGGDDDKIPVLLVIAVVTIRPERREAIRNSWLAWGDDRLALRFFTEAPDESVPEGVAEAKDLKAEVAEYGDLVVLDIERGMNFAVKLLSAMKYASGQFKFDFFLRLDDDYFVCVDRLLDELEALKNSLAGKSMESPMPVDEGLYPPPARPQLMLYAGYRYCARGQTRMDEAYMLLSGDLAHRLLSLKDLPCGTHAGISAGWWFAIGSLANPGGDVRWVHDSRLDHRGHLVKSVANRNATLGSEATTSAYASVCDRYMGVHHAYPEEMAQLWAANKDVKRQSSPEGGAARGRNISGFQYLADNKCAHTAGGVSPAKFEMNHVQLCESFHTKKSQHCGAQGC